jgi:hypothetical protein
MIFLATLLSLSFFIAQLPFLNQYLLAQSSLDGETTTSQNFIESLKKGQVPEASTRGGLPYQAYSNCPNACRNLADVANMLSQALGEAGYSQQAWYLIDEHNKNVTVAVITQLEQIQSDGRPSINQKRWDLNLHSARNGSQK